VRLSQLAAESGTSIPTIKFYIREGLLPPGRVVSPRQAEYDDGHLARLRLVRALVDVGGLSLAAVREVLAAMAGPDGVDRAVGVAHGALSPKPAATGPFARAGEVVELLGWQVDQSSSEMAQLEAALAAAAQVGLPLEDERLRLYGTAAMTIAEHDVANVPTWQRDDPTAMVTSVVLGTVLYEPLLLALRRLAQSDAYQRRR
jgi:DNA-binding transcriptional MerR regulator